MREEQLEAWFAHVRDVLEAAYVEHDEPWKQSGMSGPEARWTALRKPVADSMDRSGSFLDVGCANGYLLQCCLAWTAERGVQIDPYGIDLSPRLIALAQERLPRFADHFTVANAFEWIPPRRFDFVRTELVYVPADYERQYLDHLVAHYLSPGGRLLIANYMEDDPHPERGLLPGSHPTRHILARLGELGIRATGYRDGFDPIKGRKTRVAIVAV